MVHLTLQWFHEATVVNLTIHRLDHGELLNNCQTLHTCTGFQLKTPELVVDFDGLKPCGAGIDGIGNMYYSTS